MMTEAEVLEYVLGLDALGEGLGAEAGEIYVRACNRDVRPLLLKQRSLLKRGADDWVVRAVDVEIAAAWGRCLEQLKTLWLTQGRGLEAVP